MSDQILLPILKDTSDPHYRYKMPKLTAKVEGNGNGIKTVLTNISSVARSLGRPASYPTKYFGCELGAQVQMQDDLYIVNGAHDPEKLLALLYAFIKKFVLCPKCSNPETDLIISSASVIKQKCIACGHSGVINKATHKLTTYIVNHPPSTSDSSMNGVDKTTGKEKNGKEKGVKGEKKSATKKSSKSVNGTNGSSVEKKQEETSLEVNNDEDGFDDEELSEQAYLDRLHDGLATGMFINDPKKSADVFYKLVKAKKESGVLNDAQVQKDLFKDAGLLGIKDKATLVLGELLFTELFFDEIVTYRMLLLRFCSENEKAQKYLLGAYEKLVADVYKDALFANATKILKQLYDQDIVEEEVIIEWAAKESKKYVSKDMSKKLREKVAPFIKWLKEADEDEDEDEVNTAVTTNGKQSNGNGNHSDSSSPVEEESPQEDDDGFLEFSHRVSGLKISTQADAAPSMPPTSSVVNNGSVVEDDIDIDNI